MVHMLRITFKKRKMEQLKAGPPKEGADAVMADATVLS